MDKNDKMVLKLLVEKELKQVKREEKEIIFPELAFLKSVDEYERILKNLLKELE